MGIDTTPGPDGPEPEGRDDVPGWSLLPIVVIAAVVALLILWVFFNESRPL